MASEMSSATGENTVNTTTNTEGNDSTEEDDDIYEVEKIVGMTTSKGKTLFKVRWAGYSPSWDTWEPYENLESCKDMVDEYAHSHGSKSAGRSSSSNSKSNNNDTRSDSSSDISKQSSKSKKSNFYYVDADGAEADTLKDKFWRNLEQGKINVFGSDMYSKVKNTGRSARPSSFKEVFQPKETSVLDEEPKATKKRKVSKSKERKKAEPKTTKKNTTKKATTTKTKKGGGRKASTKTAKEETVENIPSPTKVKLQRTKAQTARKRISKMLEQQADSGSSNGAECRQSVSDDSDSETDSEVLNSSANGKAISEASYGSTEEELQAEGMLLGNYDHEVEESVDDSQTQLEDLYECDDLLHEEVEYRKQGDARDSRQELKITKPKTEEATTTYGEQLDLKEDETGPPLSIEINKDSEIENEKKEQLEQEEIEVISDPESANENIGDESKPVKKDQKLASPCKVVVKRIPSGSLVTLNSSSTSKDPQEESSSQFKEEHIEVETDANGNLRTKLKVQSMKKRKSLDSSAETKDDIVVQEKRQNRKTTENKTRKGRGKKNQETVLSEQTEDVQDKEEDIEMPIRLPLATAGTASIGPPAGATQQAASLFRTKASVKIYDPTQTSSPNSSEQSIRTPQTPITPESSTQGQQPLSVNSNVSDSQQAVIHPSPSCSLPSPVTPRTPSVSGNDDLPFELDLDEIDLSTWDSAMPTELKLTDGLELSNAEFRQAVHSNSYDKVRQALNTRRKYDLEQPDAQGMTLVMVAAYFGFDDVLELLVLSGADMNARQKNGMTALMYACQQGHRCTVELLILMGAHVNPHQNNGETALIKGVKRGNKHIVRLLLDHGANFAAQAQDNTALKYAKQLANQNEIVEVLNSHITRLTSEFESQVQITLNNTAKIQCALFSMQCFALCEAEKFHITFNHDLQPTRSGVGMLLFIAHAKFTQQEIKCRFYGPCAVTSAVLNGVTLSPLTEEANFVLSFSPLHHGRNDLDIFTVKTPKSKAKLVVCAYKAQLTMPPD